MQHRIRPRHAAIALASCGVLVSALVLPTAPAGAAPIPTQYVVQGGSDSDSSGACTAPLGTDSVTNGPKSLVNGKASGGVNLATTWTDTGTPNPSDVTTVTGHYGGSAHLKKSNGAVRSASLTGSGSLNITRALGSSSICHVSATLDNILAFQSKQPTGWYYVTRSTSAHSIAETIIVDETFSNPVMFELYQGGKNKVTQRAFVKSGKYITELVAGIQAGEGGIFLKGGKVQRAALTNTLSLVFHKAGSAAGGTKGAAGTYVAFPGSVSCAHHSATLAWKSGAGKVKSGAFFVNGAKKGSDGHPVSGDKIVLRHLSSTADLKITAKLALKGGGSVQATRSYVPCKA